MACQVYLDDEVVQFHGETPKRVQDVLFFLEDFLKQQQKQLVNASLDNKALSFSDFATSTKAFKAIKCTSQRIVSEKISKILENFKHHIAKTPQILTSDTEQILQLTQTFVQELFKLLNVLKEERYLLSIVHEPMYLQWIDTLTQTLENKDFGLMYDVIQLLIPLLEETQKQCL